MSDARAGQRPSRHPKPAKNNPATANPKGSGASGADKGKAKTADKAKTTHKQRAADLPPAALETFGLAKDYGGIPALEPLDLAIEPGESVVLIGHNGSGKTTMLRMVAGLLEPTDGHALVHGEPTGSMPARAAISYLADNPTFYEDLSLWEHLEYVARMHGMVDWEQQAADLLGHLGLYERADDLPSQFSRGMRQKASISIGLIRPFGLLLVDEPFVGLDASGKAALLDLLDEAHGDGATVVVATHELEFVQRVQRCVALRDGVLIHDGPAAGVDVLALVS
jgi:ABC-2 type transport system ATP-binding protein